MRQFAFTAAFACLTLPAFAEDAAVLIGVDRYDEFRRVSDATDILDAAREMRAAGYQVSTLSNGTSADIRTVLGAFADEALSAGRLVVALSGRFVTDEDRTWFLAKDANTLPMTTPMLSEATICEVSERPPAENFSPAVGGYNS